VICSSKRGANRGFEHLDVELLGPDVEFGGGGLVGLTAQLGCLVDAVLLAVELAGLRLERSGWSGGLPGASSREAALDRPARAPALVRLDDA
jgi:hypothetical protein